MSDRLIADGFRVVAIDNLITGSTDNIAHLAGNQDFTFIRHNVSEFIFVPSRVDYVFHFASPASPIDYLELPIPTLKVGALGTDNALGLAKEKTATFVLASTSECYGDPLVHPQNEEYWGNVNPVGPRGVYDEAKRFAEAMTMAYHRFHGLDTKIVRIFNIYGPNSFLALKISYVNALSSICEATGADIEKVAEGIGADNRIGRSFRNAGLGYGGSCFPKDIAAFIAISEQIGEPFHLLREVQRINQHQRERFVKKLCDTLWVLKGKRIAVWGLTFKPHTDDVRSSVAIDL